MENHEENFECEYEYEYGEYGQECKKTIDLGFYQDHSFFKDTCFFQNVKHHSDKLFFQVYIV